MNNVNQGKLSVGDVKGRDVVIGEGMKPDNDFNTDPNFLTYVYDIANSDLREFDAESRANTVGQNANGCN